MLALAVVLSSYERRSMSLLHNRDAPIAYLLLGLGQPIADGGKLVMKTMVQTDRPWETTFSWRGMDAHMILQSTLHSLSGRDHPDDIHEQVVPCHSKWLGSLLWFYEHTPCVHALLLLISSSHSHLLDLGLAW